MKYDKKKSDLFFFLAAPMACGSYRAKNGTGVPGVTRLDP